MLSRIIPRNLIPQGNKMLINLQRYGYIKKKELDEIENDHGETKMQKLIMYGKQAKHIYKQGFKQLRKDFSQYTNLKLKMIKSSDPISEEEKVVIYKMKKQFQRLKTLFIIQILPFSGPLLLYYIYAYPTEIPSWFCIDTMYEDYQRACIVNQNQAITYFTQNPLDYKFDFESLPSQKLKVLSNLLFGHYEDGLTGYHKVRPEQRKQYFISQSFSKYLLKRNIKKQFKKEKIDYPETSQMSLQEKILWKYEKIMKGQIRLKYTQVHVEEQATSNNAANPQIGSNKQK